MEEPSKVSARWREFKTEQQHTAGGSGINLLKGEQDTIREREKEKGMGGWKLGVGFEVEEEVGKGSN